MYQQTRLSDTSAIGTPGPLPYVIASWSNAPTLLADLTGHVDPQFGFEGTGFWPVIVSDATYDPATHVPTGGVVLGAADATAKQWAATQAVRALTADELAANLAAAQQAKIASLTASCAAQIVGGFTSFALGAAHTYPSKIPVDQINLMGSVTDSLLPGLASNWTTPFWVMDQAGTWSFQPHTAAQIQQAGADGKANVANCQSRLASLSAQVMAATTVTDVNAVAW